MTIEPDGGNRKAPVSEQLGIVQIEVRYSRPGVKGREGQIWGTKYRLFRIRIWALYTLVGMAWAHSALGAYKKASGFLNKALPLAESDFERNDMRNNLNILGRWEEMNN